jgi:toxin ParE1/3/4
MLVNWTDPALEDLDGIYAFIARDSLYYADNFVQQIIDSVTRLELGLFRESGRAVPEANRADIREIIFQGYRSIYLLVNDQQIDVLAVIHSSRDLTNPKNQPWEAH